MCMHRYNLNVLFVCVCSYVCMFVCAYIKLCMIDYKYVFFVDVSAISLVCLSTSNCLRNRFYL